MVKRLSEMTEAETADYLHAANATVRSILPEGAAFMLHLIDRDANLEATIADDTPVDPAAARRFADSLEGK